MRNRLLVDHLVAQRWIGCNLLTSLFLLIAEKNHVVNTDILFFENIRNEKGDVWESNPVAAQPRAWCQSYRMTPGSF